MPPAYLYLDDQQRPHGPHTLAELKSMVADGRLPATTLAAPVGSQDWKLVSPEAGLPPAPPPPPDAPAKPSSSSPAPAPSLGASSAVTTPTPRVQRPTAQMPSRLSSTPPPVPGAVPGRRTRRRSFRWGWLAFLAVVLLLGGLVAVDALLSWPMVHKVRQLTGFAGRPHPAARWYLFGHDLGRRHARVQAALGVANDVQAADLAYALKVLGVDNPPPRQFEFCLEGYRDGMGGQKARYVLSADGVEESFPEALRGL